MTPYMRNWLAVQMRRPDPNAPVFEVFERLRVDEDEPREWGFRERLKGRVISTAGEGFTRKGGAKRAAYAHAARVPGSTVKIISK